MLFQSLNLPAYDPAIDLDALFARLGKIGAIVGSVNAVRGSTVPGMVDALADLFDDDPAGIDGLYASLASYQSTPAGYLNSLQSLASRVVVDAANAPGPLPDARLSTALAEVVRQMSLGLKTVSASAVSATITPASSNAGNPAFVASVKARAGMTLENAFAESILISCTGDSATGGETAGRESFTFRGQPSASPTLSHAWPAGSGASRTIYLVIADVDGSSGTQNHLTNSDFETWTVPNIPDGWTIATGTAGSTVKRSTASKYRGGSSLSVVGDGSESTAIHQSLSLPPLTTFAANLFARVDVAPASGVLEVSLVDGSGSAILDASGTPNLFTADLTAIGSGWSAVNGVFRTPRILPSAVRLRVRLSSPLSAGSTLFVDDLAFAEMTQLYPQGPYVAGFSGNAVAALGDSAEMSVTNDRAGQFQTLLDRLFGMRGLGLLLPSTTGTPTFANSLIS